MWEIEQSSLFSPQSFGVLKCCYWATLNKSFAAVDFLLVFFLLFQSFSSRSASPLQRSTRPAVPSAMIWLLLSEEPIPVRSHSVLSSILPAQGRFCSSSQWHCQHQVSQEPRCSQAASEEDACAASALCPVQGASCLTSPGSHVGKALVTASQRKNAAISHGDSLIPEKNLVS